MARRSCFKTRSTYTGGSLRLKTGEKGLLSIVPTFLFFTKECGGFVPETKKATKGAFFCG